MGWKTVQHYELHLSYSFSDDNRQDVSWFVHIGRLDAWLVDRHSTQYSCQSRDASGNAFKSLKKHQVLSPACSDSDMTFIDKHVVQNRTCSTSTSLLEIKAIVHIDTC